MDSVQPTTPSDPYYLRSITSLGTTTLDWGWWAISGTAQAAGTVGWAFVPKTPLQVVLFAIAFAPGAGIGLVVGGDTIPLFAQYGSRLYGSMTSPAAGNFITQYLMWGVHTAKVHYFRTNLLCEWGTLFMYGSSAAGGVGTGAAATGVWNAIWGSTMGLFGMATGAEQKWFMKLADGTCAIFSDENSFAQFHDWMVRQGFEERAKAHQKRLMCLAPDDISMIPTTETLEDPQLEAFHREVIPQIKAWLNAANVTIQKVPTAEAQMIGNWLPAETFFHYVWMTKGDLVKLEARLEELDFSKERLPVMCSREERAKRNEWLRKNWHPDQFKRLLSAKGITSVHVASFKSGKLDV